MPHRFRIIALALTAIAVGSPHGANSAEDDEVVYRPPFTLKVPINSQQYYEEEKGKIPFVYHGMVTLFFRDRFGLKIDIQGDSVRNVKYEGDLSKADLTLEFGQGDPVNGNATSLLRIENRTKYTFVVDAAITVPDRKEILSTSFAPIRARQLNWESWPQAIVELTLRNFRVQK